MVGRLELGRRNVTEWFEQAATVVSCDPLERRELDVLESLPRVRDDGSPPSRTARSPSLPARCRTSPRYRRPTDRCQPGPTVPWTGSTGSLRSEVDAACGGNREVYGVRKVWKQLQARRAGRGPRYGGAPDVAILTAHPADLVTRQFTVLRRCSDGHRAGDAPSP